MSINLHSGGELVIFDDLCDVPTPERTATHVPLPHQELVNMTEYALGYFGHEIVEEHHAIDHEGARYFGLLSLRSTYGDYTDTVDLRTRTTRRTRSALPLGPASSSAATSRSSATTSSAASTRATPSGICPASWRRSSSR